MRWLAGGDQPQDGDEVDIGATIMHHITDSHQIEIPWFNETWSKTITLPHIDPISIGGWTIDISPTKHVVFMWLVALLLLLVFTVLARPKLIPRGLYNLMEIIVVFIRDEVVRPNVPGTTADRLTPFFLTMFFFILFCNLMGLFPFGATATGNVAVTAALAIVTFFMTQIVSITKNGIVAYLKHLTQDTPWYLWIIMIPVEIIGLFTKPFALCIRLFANMTGGHVIIVSLLGLILVLKSAWVAVVSVPFSIFIYLLEIFVGFLQAYIFTLLSALFIGMGIHEEHEAEAH